MKSGFGARCFEQLSIRAVFRLCYIRHTGVICFYFNNRVFWCGSTASTSWGLSGCAESALNDGSTPEWDAAGETAVVRIKMAAKNTSNAVVRAGDITLRYKSRF